LFEPYSFSSRGIIIADISKDNYTFTLIAVHLKSKIEDTPGESAIKRHNQVVKLREEIKKILENNPDSNIIICGDFNDPPGRDAQEVAAGVPDLMEEMTEPIQLDSGQGIEIRNATLEHKDKDQNSNLWTEKSGAHPPVLFDYFFLSKGAWEEFKKIDHIYPEEFVNIMKASDHIPVILDLKDE
jgi:endonuclease/exonuclease/phosphatase family metal-dependent hydrolase